MISLLFIKADQSLPHSEQGMGLLGAVMMISLILLGTYTSFVVIQSQSSISEVKSTAQNAKLLLRAIQHYQSSHAGSVPTLLESLYLKNDEENCSLGIDVSNNASPMLQGWCGPYLQESFEGYPEDLFDGWGSRFNWSSASSTLTSCGPDRTCRNSDDLEFKL